MSSALSSAMTDVAGMELKLDLDSVGFGQSDKDAFSAAREPALIWRLARDLALAYYVAARAGRGEPCEVAGTEPLQHRARNSRHGAGPSAAALRSLAARQSSRFSGRMAPKPDVTTRAVRETCSAVAVMNLVTRDRDDPDPCVPGLLTIAEPRRPRCSRWPRPPRPSAPNRRRC